MKAEFWQERWEENRIGFHQSAINPYIQRFLSKLTADRPARIFVPLCGKSRDMGWLAEQGHQVISCELSEIAVEAFFEEHDLMPEKRTEGALIRYTSGSIEILQGDFFELTPELLGHVDAVYDRAALIALPPEMQARYVGRLTTLLPSNTRLLLITIEYPDGLMDGPPFSVGAERIRELFDPAFRIEKIEAVDIIDESPRFQERGLTSLIESVYFLERV